MNGTKMTYLHKFNFRRSPYIVGLSLMLATSILPATAHASASASLLMTPATGTYQAGSTVTVTVYEDSDTSQVSTVQADVIYPTDLLRYKSVSNTGSVFTDISPPAIVRGGLASVSRSSIAPKTGKQQVASLKFTVLASGTANLSFASSSAIYTLATIANIYGGTYQGSTFSLTGGPAPAVVASPTKVSFPTSVQSSTSITSVNYTPQGASSTVTTPNGATVQANAPVTVAPVTDQTRTVTKVGYYLNKKLIATKTEQPWSHKIDTAGLRNGTYALTIKTYYGTGSPISTGQKIVVLNPASLRQAGLVASQYSWVLLLIIIGVLFYVFRKRRDTKPPTKDGKGGGSAGRSDKILPKDTPNPPSDEERIIMPTHDIRVTQ
jgi:hypothetical protein